MLHIVMTDENQGTLERLKFAVNHPYMFHSATKANVICLLEFFVNNSVELCNIIVILCFNDPFDIVVNFVAIQIIA